MFCIVGIKVVVQAAVFKGSINYTPQMLLLDPNKYYNPILRPSVTSNFSKQPIELASEVPLLNNLQDKIVSQFVLSRDQKRKNMKNFTLLSYQLS